MPKNRVGGRKKVLLFNSRLKLFIRKLKLRWPDPFEPLKIYRHGTVDLLNQQIGDVFKVNAKKVKNYRVSCAQ